MKLVKYAHYFLSWLTAVLRGLKLYRLLNFTEKPKSRATACSRGGR
jgi:hypothetical protein